MTQPLWTIPSTATEMRFQQLPTEIILQILDHLTSQCPNNLANTDECTNEAGLRDYQQTLAVLSLTCKHFHHLLQPLLYRTYHKASNNITPPFREYKPAFTFRKYLSTLLRRPDLASKLQTLHLGSWETKQSINDQQPSLTPQKRPSGEQKDLYRKHAKHNPLPPGLSNDLRSGYEDAEIALLLTLTPTLTTLTLELQPILPLHPQSQAQTHQHRFNTILQESLRGPTSRIHTFSSLTNIHIRCPEKSSSYGITLPSIQNFLLLPSLTSLTLEDLNQAPSDLEAFTLFPRSSGVEALCLRNCKLDVPALSALLRSFEGLEKLKVEVKRDRAFAHLRSSAFSATAGWRGLVSALKEHVDTLVELDIYADGNTDLMRDLHFSASADGEGGGGVGVGGGGEGGGGGGGGGGGVLGGTLKKFSKLKGLAVQEVVLLGSSSSSSSSSSPTEGGEVSGGADHALCIADILPPSLQTLTIAECHVERPLVECLEAVLDSVAAAECGLESIGLRFGRTCDVNVRCRREWSARFGSVVDRLEGLGVVVSSDGAGGRDGGLVEKRLVRV